MSTASQYLVRTMVIADLHRKYENNTSRVGNQSASFYLADAGVWDARECPVVISFCSRSRVSSRPGWPGSALSLTQTRGNNEIMEELTCFLFTNLQLLAWSNIATFPSVASIQLTHILVNCHVRPPIQCPPRSNIEAWPAPMVANF